MPGRGLKQGRVRAEGTGMTPVWIVPRAVPAATVRRLHEGVHEAPPVQQVAVRAVPSPSVLPRQIDPVGLRLMALQLENDDLRSELQELRTA